MRVTHFLVAVSLLLAQAGPAAAGAAGGLLPGGRTISGPAPLLLAMGASERVHNDGATNRNVCVTVLNTGRSQVTMTLTGTGNPTTDVAPGSSKALCVDSAQFVDVSCTGASACSAQWRVDSN